VVGPLKDDQVGTTASADRVPLFGDGSTDVGQSDDEVVTLTGSIRGAKSVTDGPTTALVPGRGAVQGRQNYSDFGPAHGKGGYTAFGQDRVYGNIGFADGHVATFRDTQPTNEGFAFDNGVTMQGIITVRYQDIEGKVFGGWLTRPGFGF